MECFAKKVNFSRELFSQNAPSYMFDRVLNTPLESTKIFFTCKKPNAKSHSKQYLQNIYAKVSKTFYNLRFILFIVTFSRTGILEYEILHGH